jgi:hypothetical protein
MKKTPSQSPKIAQFERTDGKRAILRRELVHFSKVAAGGSTKKSVKKVRFFAQNG